MICRYDLGEGPRKLSGESDIGGQKGIEGMMDKADLRRLTGSINFARNLKEGPRHLGKIDAKWDPAAALPLWQAHGIVLELVKWWIGSKIKRAGEQRPR